MSLKDFLSHLVCDIRHKEMIHCRLCIVIRYALIHIRFCIDLRYPSIHFWFCTDFRYPSIHSRFCLDFTYPLIHSRLSLLQQDMSVEGAIFLHFISCFSYFLQHTYGLFEYNLIYALNVSVSFSFFF